jgi:hypothetical protein
MTDKQPNKVSRKEAVRAIGKPKPSAREVAARLRRESRMRELRIASASAAMDAMRRSKDILH